MTVRRAVILAVVSVVFLGTLCVGIAQAQQETITLRIWHRLTFMEDVVEMFNQKMEAEGKNVAAVFEQIPYAEQVTKFMCALAAGNAPDVYALDLIQYPYFTSLGAFRDITEEAKALPYFDDLPEKILALGMEEDKIYALPAVFDLSALLWNKDLFEAAGLDPDKPPTTWAELIEYGQKLTKDLDGDGIIDQWGFAVAGKSGGAYMFWFMPFVWANGGDILSEDGTTVLFDSPETVEAVTLWVDSIHRYKIAPLSSVHWSSGDRYNLFAAGRLAMFLSGNFNVPTIHADAPSLHFDVTPIMGSADAHYASFAGGDLIGVTTQSKHPELAWEFVKFFQSEEVMIEIFAKNLVLPSRPTLYDNKYFREMPEMIGFADLLTVAQAPYTLKYNELYDPMLFFMEKALLGEISPEEAVKEAAKAFEDIIQ